MRPMTVNSAIWRDQLTPEERAVLGPADEGVAGATPDVLVVGGGILGVTTAAACSEAGLGDVMLIETGRLGAGATGGATGLLIPEPHQWSDPEPFVDLRSRQRSSPARSRSTNGSGSLHWCGSSILSAPGWSAGGI